MPMGVEGETSSPPVDGRPGERYMPGFGVCTTSRFAGNARRVQPQWRLPILSQRAPSPNHTRRLTRPC